MADPTPTPLTDSEARALATTVASHRVARAHMVNGEVRWACDCGQPLEPSDPSAAFGDLTSHQVHEVLIVAHDIKTNAEAAARADERERLGAAVERIADLYPPESPPHNDYERGRRDAYANARRALRAVLAQPADTEEA